MRSERSLRREEPATDTGDRSRSQHNSNEDAAQTTPDKSVSGSREHHLRGAEVPYLRTGSPAGELGRL